MINESEILWDDEINPDDVEWDLTPDFSLSRLGKQVARGWQQGLASLEQSQAGASRAMAREIEKEQTIPREVVSERDPKFKLRRPPLPTVPHADLASRYGEKIKSPAQAGDVYRGELEKEAREYEQTAKSRPEMLPGTPKGIGGLTEQAISSFAQFGPTMLLSAINIPFGTATAFKQIHGMKYAELKELGIDDKRANDLAMITAAVNTPLEEAGTVLQLGAARRLLLGKGGSGWLRRFVGSLVQSSGGNALEEFLQQPADDIATLVAQNKDVTPEELGKIAGRSVEAAKVGAVAGAILPLAGQAGRVSMDAGKSVLSVGEQTTPETQAEIIETTPEQKIREDLESGVQTVERLRSLRDQLPPEQANIIDTVLAGYEMGVQSRPNAPEIETVKKDEFELQETQQTEEGVIHEPEVDIEDLYDDAHEAGRYGMEMPNARKFIGRDLTELERKELNDAYESGKFVQEAVDAARIREGEGRVGEEVPREGRRPEEMPQEGEAPSGDQLLAQAPPDRERGAQETGIKPEDSVKEFNTQNPEHDLRYDGEQDRTAINKPPLYNFTAYEGPAKGATFSVESPTVENIKAKLDEMVDLRNQDRRKSERRQPPQPDMGGAPTQISDNRELKPGETLPERRTNAERRQAIERPKETKREKSLREYLEFVDGLTDEQKSKAGDTIIENPSSPGIQRIKIQKALSEIAKHKKVKPESAFDKKLQKQIKKLRNTAERTKSSGEIKYNQDRLSNTARRARMAASAQAEAAYQIQIAETMFKIADGLESGELQYLSGVAAKSHIERLDSIARQAHYEYLRKKYDSYAEQQKHKDEPLDESIIPYIEYPDLPNLSPSDRGSINRLMKGKRGIGAIRSIIEQPITYDRAKKILSLAKKYGFTKELNWSFEDRIKRIAQLKNMGIDDTNQLMKAIREYIDLRAGRKKEDPIKAAERELQGMKGIGIDFFPTTKTVANEMVDKAEIEEGMDVLEPSAGKGDIADAIREKVDVDPDVVEMSQTLQNILNLKKYKLVGTDFLEYSGKKYDRILMNPPFSKNRDIQHVKHAYTLLKPGGRIVAIMSEHGFFANDKQSRQFREWIDDKGYSEKLPEGSFKGKETFNQAGVNSRIVVIDKSVKSSKIIETLKNETGSSELANDILTKGAELYQSGAKTFGRFRREMRKAFKNVWDKIKKHIRNIWDLINNQRGEITIKEATDEELVKRYFGKSLTEARERRAKAKKETPVKKEPVERVGSVNLARQNVSEMAKDIQAAVVKEKESISWEETEAQSDKKIKNAQNFKTTYSRMKKIAGGKLSSDIDAMREVNVIVATKMEQALSDFKDGKISDAELQEKITAFDDLLTTTSEASSEIGRALNIHKKMVSPDRIYKSYKAIKSKANKRQLDLIHTATTKLLDGTLSSDEMKRIEAEIPDPTLSEYLMEYWYNCILSGPPTHLVNVISNTGWSMFQIPHKMLISGIDKVYTTLSGEERTRYLNETIPMLAGYRRGLKKGAKAAREMFKTGSVTEFEDKWTQEMGYFKSAFERSPYRALRKIAPYITVPTKALRAMDVWANSIAYEGALGSMARRQANNEGAKDLRKRTDEILKEWSEKMPNEVHDAALKEARYATFTDTPDKLTGYIIAARNVKGLGPVMRTIIPFVNTISNLTKRGVEMTPFLGIGKEYVSRRMGRGQSTPEVIAKQIEGAIISLVILSIAGQGKITGPMPEKKNEREQWYRTGKKPWAIKIGDTWYEYRRMEPFNTVIAIAASLHDKIINAEDEKTATDMFFDFANQVKWNLLDGSYFSGLQSVLNRHGKQKTIIPRYVASWVPFSSFFRSINRATEVAMGGSAKPREGKEIGSIPKEWAQSFSQVIPGLSGKMPAKITLWGEEAVIPGGILRQWLPYKWATEKYDAVEKALESAGYYPGLPRKYVTVHGDRIDLDDSMYRDYALNFGAALKDRFKKTINKPAWKDWDEKRKFSALRRDRLSVGRKIRYELIAKLRNEGLLAKK